MARPQFAKLGYARRSGWRGHQGTPDAHLHDDHVSHDERREVRLNKVRSPTTKVAEEYTHRMIRRVDPSCRESIVKWVK